MQVEIEFKANIIYGRYLGTLCFLRLEVDGFTWGRPIIRNNGRLYINF